MDALGDGNRGRVMEIITGKAPPSHEMIRKYSRGKYSVFVVFPDGRGEGVMVRKQSRTTGRQHPES